MTRDRVVSAAMRAIPEQAGSKPVDRASAGSIRTRRISEIQAMPVRWLWPGRVARGKVTIIAGNPGLGKSQITASIAAIVTTGGFWPVDRVRSEVGDVVFLSAEDDPADTLRPRLEAAGARIEKVHVLESVVSGYTADGEPHERGFSLQADLNALSAKLAELGQVAAVVIDPITAYLGDVDSHKNAEVRALLTPLGEFATKHNVAIIVVSHLNKSAGTDALMRVTGSLAFVAAARAAWLVAQDPEDRARRFFLPMKNNIGPDESGLAFRIEGATVPSSTGPLKTSHVSWESEPVSVRADEVMTATRSSESSSAVGEARDWLEGFLAQPRLRREIDKAADAAGIKPATLRRASKALGVVTQKLSMGGGWEWSLPRTCSTQAEDAHQKSVSTFREFEHIREQDEETVVVDI